ncbi:MAG: hypothetical protein AABZ57_01750, partial [Candidatus Margulisiibacteriota bacterium]
LASHAVQSPVYLALVVVIIISALWNIRVFFTDIYPAVMSPAFLVRQLKKLGIKRFYTYKTNYNAAFVDVIDPKDAKGFEIKYTDKMEDIKDPGAFLVTPGISSKSVMMESQWEAYNNKDFRSDPLLNYLVDTNKVKDAAAASFKTYGTSRYWPNDTEATSYRYLFLHEITDEDRRKGYAYILSVDKALKLRS